ncbi:hypothetical protein ACIQXW_17480 [Lysinibacillus sp. NPDC097162]|uniref:hypothetical protein n=1 Tax=Lysinibacillus sp. NPDC097162 TaxID=3364140 RepID=UPI00381EC5AC
MEHALTFDLENRTATKYNEETGEVLERFRMVSEEDDKKAQRQREGLKKAQLREEARNKRGNDLEFIQCIQEPLTKLVSEPELIECGYFMRLLSHMRQKNGGLLTDGKEPLKQAKIQKIFDKGDRRTREILTRLEEVGLIKSQLVKRSKVYYVNEVFHTRGKQKGKKAHFVKLMKDELDKNIRRLSNEALGLLYKIIPFFHYKNFMLTTTPNETDLDKVKALSLAGLAKLLNHDEDTIDKYMNELNDNGVVLYTKTKKSHVCYVHPDVLWSDTESNTDKADELRADFLREMFKAH